MIRRDELPDDAAEWHSINVQFEPLPQDDAASCPRSEEEIFEYVQTESADLDDAARDRLLFCRTAQVADSKYWLWEYTESDGELVFVSYRVSADGSSFLCLVSANGLSPAQFLLADHYGEVYWS